MYLRLGVFFRFYPENHKDSHVHGKPPLPTCTDLTKSAADWQSNELITRLVINEDGYCH